MKIVDVRTGVIGTPWRNLTLVELRTDDGLRGVGEVRMVNHTDALLGYLATAVPTHVLGSDPFEIESLVQRMIRNDYARAGELSMSGVAAVELGCWDIVGQAVGQPVHRLLGGAVRERIPAYANGWYSVERTPEEFHAAARAPSSNAATARSRSIPSAPVTWSSTSPSAGDPSSSWRRCAMRSGRTPGC